MPACVPSYACPSLRVYLSVALSFCLSLCKDARVTLSALFLSVCPEPNMQGAYEAVRGKGTRVIDGF